MEAIIDNQQQLYTELPHVEKFSFQKHPKRFLNKKLLAKVLFFFPAIIAAGIVYFTAEETWISILVAIAWFLATVIGLFLSYKDYFVRGYILRDLDITYRRGWLFHHQITVPFNRIQHTEISHGPIDRLFQLKELEIYTAGGSNSDLKISGLEPDEAERLKEFIADKVATHA